ncbi:FAD-binding protein [Geodermatophilus sp. SYSU D00867]
MAGQIGRRFEPTSLRDLVHVVSRATDEGHQLTVVGNGWSQEGVAYSSDWTVSITNLSRRLLDVFALPTDQNRGQFARVTTHLVHQEAGIRIYHLNQELSQIGLALPALGGANGQTLAGAISTGTHGGDVGQPPMCDLVAAFHFVTDGGREVWVERASDPVTDDAQLAVALRCRDLEIVRDDAVFSAVQVGLGRFGVLYSCVLRVVPAFRVAEWTVIQPRDLVIGALTAGRALGEPVKPLLDLLPPPAAFLQVVDPANPGGLEVVFDSNNPTYAWVRRRWQTAGGDFNMVPYVNSLCDLGAEGLLNDTLRRLRSQPFPRNHIASAAADEIEPALRSLLAQSPAMTAGRMMAYVLDALWETKAGGSAIPEATAGVFLERYTTSIQGRIGPYHDVVTGSMAENDQPCYRADSIEPVFDAMQQGCSDFLRIALELALNYRQAGYIALRWSRTSTGLLSMHGFPSSLAVAIEISSVRHLSGNEEWFTFLQNVASGVGGRLHWGQINELTAAHTAASYGTRLTGWRHAD